MELTEEIRTLFAGSDVDSACKLEKLNKAYPAPSSARTLYPADP